MDDWFEMPALPEPSSINGHPGYTASQMRVHAIIAQTELIGRLAQMQEHEAIEWLLKARQDWWKS